VPQPDCASCHIQPTVEVPRSPHGSLGAQVCSSCHGAAHRISPAAQVSPQQCSTCHADEVKDYQSGIHWYKRKEGDTEAATCASCHGITHKIQPASDPASPVAKKNLPDTCGNCHANPEFLVRHNIPFARPVEAYRLSVHGWAVAAGNPSAATCSDCHGNHAIFPGRDPRSRINHWNVPQTCGACHKDILKTYQESVHGQAVAAGVRDAPVCTDCHGEHNILAPSNPQSLVNPARLSSVTCGRCHGDERLIQRYNLPADRVPTFEDSYHGLALQAGAQTVANCASCHGVHNIFPSSDPRSTVNPANLTRTCGACHAGAGERFAIGPVHVVPSSTREKAIVKWIRAAYRILIPLTIGFMVLHNLLDFLAKLIRGRSPVAASGQEFERMNLHFRIPHWLVAASFPLLVWTGFALKYPNSWWAQIILRCEGGFSVRGTLHRIAAVVLISAMVYHVVHLIVSRRARVILRFLQPDIQDVADFWAIVRYNLGLAKQRPYFRKFNYAEKIEYVAFFWGMGVMALSGFLLWFNSFTLRHFPKWVADAATAVHFYEAILAALSILVWHLYMTIFDPDVYPMDRSWLTGKTSAEHLRHTRPAYYLTLLRKQPAESSTAPPAPAVPETKATPNAPPGKGTTGSGTTQRSAASPPPHEKVK